jgi:hypothetical protein
MRKMSLRKQAVWLACLFLFCLTITPVALGQNISGSILGTVKDSSGAMVASAPVTITNQNTGIEMKTQTSVAGEYVVPNLPPGVYTVRVESTGFTPQVVTDVRLLANRQARIDLTLTPGAVQQAVEVQASAPVVNSENATIGNTMESQIISQLPLNRRQLDRLVTLSAGVTTDSTSNARISGSAYWGGTRYNVDGMSFEDAGNAGGAYTGGGLMTFPSPEAISEFKIDSNNQKAEFNASASVTVVTKSGTNQYHGSVFEFNRNREYAAKNFFATGLDKPKFNRNEYGFSLGGPIRKNKTFVFGNFEDLLERSARTSTLSEATSAMRGGDFTGLATLTDPLAGTPFPSNKIPSARLDPRSVAIYNYVPLPNIAGTGNGTQNNYVVNVGQTIDIMRYLARVDHHFSEKDVVWGGFTFSDGNPFTQAQGYGPTYGNFSSVGHFTYDLNITYTHTFSPTTLNEARAGYFSHQVNRWGTNLTLDPKQWFPTLYPMPYGGLPQMNVTGFANVGDYGWTASKQLTKQYTDNFTHIVGKHTLKAGFNMLSERMNRFASAYGFQTAVGQEGAFGRFGFNGRYTAAGAAAQPAHDFADYILGYPYITYRSSPGPMLLNWANQYGVYVQDDWQATPRLSVSVGLRYELQQPWTERDGAQANLDMATDKLVMYGDKIAPQAIARLISAYPIVQASSLPDYNGKDYFLTDKKNFAPRLGLAWRPFSDNKTVVRAGAGIFYTFVMLWGGYHNLGNTNPPYLLAETFDPGAGITPAITLANPFPGSGTVSPNPGISAMERNVHNGFVQQWNVSVEREVRRNLGLRASYVGNKTSHLLYVYREMNNPYTMTPGALQPQRPFQPWASISMSQFGGDSTIHQLQLEAIQRYKSGLTFQIEYSWNRSLDDVPLTGYPQNIYCNRCDRGNSDSIRRNIFTSAYSYELPFGPGKPMANVQGPLGKLVGGWMVSGTLIMWTGTPFSVSYSPSAAGSLASRADIVPGASTAGVGNLWFNPAAFTTPVNQFTFGNSARNTLFGPGAVTIDLTGSKEVRFADRYTIQFRTDFFNMPNHANFGNPAANISSASAVGTITSAADPRQVQFGLKFLF